jgi:hypothetical protein
MDWNDIAIPVGKPSLGNLDLKLNIVIPDEADSTRASENQMRSVRTFYNRDFPDLTAAQAHLLLCCREYSRLAAESIAKSYNSTMRRFFALGLAAFILSDERIREFAKIWNEKNFRTGSSMPRVQGTPFFPDLLSFFLYLEGMLEIDGWDLNTLKKGHFREVRAYPRDHG